MAVPLNTPTAVSLSGTDPQGDGLAYTVVTAPTNGTLSGDGAFLTYTPNAGFQGSDSFTFSVNNGTSDSNLATVSISVGAALPVAAADDAYTTPRKPCSR